MKQKNWKKLVHQLGKTRDKLQRRLDFSNSYIESLECRLTQASHENNNEDLLNEKNELVKVVSLQAQRVKELGENFAKTYNELEDTRYASRERINELSKMKTELSQENQELRRDKAALKNKNEELEGHSKGLREELALRISRINDLQKQVMELQDTLDFNARL